MRDITAEGLLVMEQKIGEDTRSLREHLTSTPGEEIEVCYLSRLHANVILKLLTFKVLSNRELDYIKQMQHKIFDDLELENISKERIDAVLGTFILRINAYRQICSDYQLYEILANIKNLNPEDHAHLY